MSFQADIKQIADYARIDSLALIKLIREVESLRAITASTAGGQQAGTLLAARDRPAAAVKRARRNKKH